MSQTRAERKEITRRAILDAALDLCEDSSLVALSLRQVTAKVGIVPTAFYRHFDSIEALGLELVVESFVALRAMLREVRMSAGGAFGEIVDGSIDIVAQHAQDQHRQFAFILRERNAGPVLVREAVQVQVDLVINELAADLATLPGTETWAREDLHQLAHLFVTVAVTLVEDLLAARGDEVTERRVVARGRHQFLMVLVGALNWRSHPA